MNLELEIHEDLKLPAKYAICDRCQGRGHHGNPAFDGTTTEWWLDGDPDGDDLKAYMNGEYDVPCEKRCENGKILVPDEKRCTKEQLAEYEEYLQEESEYRAVVAQELRMGA
jgi:hypothetical protein